jgi:hypothetical protein
LGAAFLAFPTDAAEPPHGLLHLLRRPPSTDAPKQGNEAIEVARQAVAEQPSPADWDSAVYLPWATPNDLLSQFLGTAIVADFKGLPSVNLTLTQAKIIGDWSEAKVEIRLLAGTSLNEDSAELVATGRLLYRGYAEKESGTATTVFRIALEPPKASANVKGKTFAAPDWITELAASGVIRILEDRLTFALPVPIDFSRPVGYDGTTTLKAGDAGTVTVRITAPGATLRKRIDKFAPIFVPSGLWLCARFEGRPQPRPSPPPAKIEDALAEYEKQGGEGAKLIISGKFLEGVVNGLGELPEAARTAKAKIVGHRDRLLNTSGDIHAKVWLHNHEGGGSLTVSPSAQWKLDEKDAAKGFALHIAAGYQSAVSANLAVHVDPGISGGVGTTVGSHGNSSGSVKGTMKTVLLQNKEDAKEPGKVLLLRADFQNQELNAEVKTDGRLKLKVLGGWESIRVPQFGVRATVPVPHNIVPGIPLVSDAPHPLEFSVADVVPDGVAIMPMEGKALPTHLVIEPSEPTHDSIGYMIPFTLHFLTLTADEATKRAATIETVLTRESRPTIAVGKIEVLLAGIVFGPNNDIIKAVRNTVETLDKAQKDIVNETERVAERVDATVTDAAEDTAEELKVAGKNIEKQVGRSAKDGERMVAKAGKDIEKNTAKAGKDIEKNAQKAGKWIKKTFGF